jgi:hypothetical protein
MPPMIKNHPAPLSFKTSMKPTRNETAADCFSPTLRRLYIDAIVGAVIQLGRARRFVACTSCGAAMLGVLNSVCSYLILDAVYRLACGGFVSRPKTRPTCTVTSSSTPCRLRHALDELLPTDARIEISVCGLL